MANKKTAPRTKKPQSKWLYLLVSIVLTAFLYAPSLENDFTNWDDPGYVTENNLIRSFDRDAVSTLFNRETFVMGNYHPITMLSLAWDYQRFGAESARGYHSMNLLYHLLATAALFWFIFELTGIAWVAGVTALVFGVHPMHVESVAWVASRKDQLYALFFFMAMASYIKYGKTGQWLWLASVLLGFIASLLSKAMAAPLPVVLLLTDFYMKRSFSWKLVVEKIPFFAVAIYFGLLAIDAQASSSAISDAFTLPQKLVFALSSLWLYVVKFFAPYQLGVLYPYPDLSSGIPGIFYVRGLLAIALFAFAASTLRRTRVLAWGLGFFGLMLVLVLQLLSVGQAIMADRYTYLPYVGLTFILAFGLDALLRNPSYKKWVNPAIGVGVIWLMFSMFTTRNRIETWKDTITLFTDQIEKYPNVGLAYNNRGKFYAADQGKLDLAFADLSKGIEVDPDYPNSYLNRGNIFGIRGEHERALQDYNRALQLEPNYFDAYLNRAITYSILQQFDRALQDFNKAESIQQSPSLYLNRAYCRLSSGDPSGSVADYSRALEFNPGNASAYYYRALAYRAIGNNDLAQRDLETAQRLGFNPPR